MGEKQKVLVLGEKPQGCVWLTQLIESQLFDIVAGITRYSDKDVWWGGDNFTCILEDNNIPVATRDQLNNYSYDILFSFLYPFIIEQEWLDKAKFCINLHEAPLPRYRGCNGYSFAILENAKTYGTTLHFMDKELDHGDIIDQIIFDIDTNETAKELYLRATHYSLELLQRCLKKIASNTIPRSKNECTDQPIKSRDSLEQIKEMSLEKSSNVADLYRITRALDFLPFEPAYFIHNNQKIYSFINSSLGRDKISANDVINCQFINTEILDRVIEIEIVQISHELRPLILMSEKKYRQLFQLFIA